MKRFSLAMTWLALAGLMTMVSCRKPVVGFTNGESRTVTVSAVTESGGGSKTSIDGLYVKWSEGDEISMNGCKLTLEDECAGSTMGRFTGKVTDDGPYLIGYPFDKTEYDGTTLKLSIPASWPYDADMKEIVPMAAYAEKVGDDVQFRNAVNMLKLKLTGDGTTASKLTSIKLTSATSYLSGDINVTFNGGVPEFAAIAGDGASKTMTVSFGDGLQLTDAAQCVYIPLAKINGGDLTVRFDCANGRYMEKKVTAISAFNAVNNMLDCGEVEVRAVPKFSVSATTKVEFAKGNLWYGIADGESAPAFHFEENQWDYSIGEWDEWSNSYKWDASHVCHFFWSNTTDWQTPDKEPYAEDYSYNKRETEDVFFTNDPEDETKPNENFQVSGEAAGTWRALSRAEWNYLLGFDPVQWAQTDDYGRPGAKAKSAWKDLGGGVSGLVILPDDADASVMGSITSTSDLATHGAVFLPAAGYRYGTYLVNVGSYGHYWSSTPNECSEVFAYYMGFGSGDAYTSDGNRDFGYAVRLVR